ncbi:hypothetical protein [Nocardia spumae]|uniref:hypothetical protein n=1 Tax=Nocardia spumae TaxID=2887190 RepID=UPI001D13F7A3|nr:hypothetical protein [Nocardia spumae]
MSTTDRYYYTFDRKTGEPFGIGDSWIGGGLPTSGRSRRAPMLTARQRAALLVLALTFAAGFYAAVLLLDRHGNQQPTVVVCPQPGTGSVAVVPAECGAPQGVTTR